MSNKMIIDASHPEETRVVVLRGNRVEEFDFESASKKPLRGNIYLAKVTRVEPSLQAAFIDYGGNRHGFLAFSEIHPDYYQIPVADRQALLEEEARAHRDDEEDANNERRSRRHRRPRGGEAESRAVADDSVSQPAYETDARPATFDGGVHEHESVAAEPATSAHEASDEQPPYESSPASYQHVEDYATSPAEPDNETSAPNLAQHQDYEAPKEIHADEIHADERSADERSGDATQVDAPHPEPSPVEEVDEDEDEVTTLGGGGDEETARAPRAREDEGEPVEVIGGDAMDETPRRVARPRRHYKIQEVIKRRQVLLVQVVKEERGNKGAALTTYLSLAGRYSVLMPNTARGGGISRKITNAQDRSRLKTIAEDLEVPDGMGVILRTAGASRTKQEVKRDFEYLLRMWETVRETTLASSAPMLVYEEGSLIKRAIRDLYSKEVEEILVAGDAGYREAKAFMRLLMPNHIRAVVPYRETQPVFAKAGVEAQLDAMFSSQVTLKSGGYIVINQTEALVAIDVNSGRSTREHNIEDTALRTNVEAADEIARQLRLRDLAGLIVVDFIDMEEGRNNRTVERRMKDALKNDRARIQVGRISHFGLLEMSRQRIRTGVLEGSSVPCAHCMGSGIVRSTSSVALHVLRVLEDALIKSAANDMMLRAQTTVALYILNHKRAHLRDLERRFGVAIIVEADDSLSVGNNHAIERGEPASGIRVSEAELEHKPAGYGVADEEDEVAIEEMIEAEDEPELLEAKVPEDEAEETEGEEGEGVEGEGDANRKRRRRRRRRGSERLPASEAMSAEAPQPADDGLAMVAEIGGDFSQVVAREGEEGGRPNGVRRRRSRRGRRGERDRGFAPIGEGAEAGEAGEGASEFEPETEGFAAEMSPAVDADIPQSETAVVAHEAENEPAAAESALGEPAAPAEPVTTEPTAVADSPATEHVVAEAAPVAALAESAPTDEPQASPVASAEMPPEAPAAPEPEPAVEEPPRPRRSGWWQRAKSTLVGE